MDAKVEALIRKHLGEKALPPKKTIKTSKPAKRTVARPTVAVAHPRPSQPVRPAIAKSVEAPHPEAKGSSFPINLDVFKQAIQTVAYAISNPDRPALNAVLIEGKPGVLSATAVDGHILAHAEFEYDLPLEVKTPIPAQYFNEIFDLKSPARIVDYDEGKWGDASFSIKDTHGTVVSIKYRVNSAPEWRHLVPFDSTSDASFSIQANRLASIIRVCKPEPGDINVPIAFTFNPDGRLDIERGRWHAEPNQTRQILATLPYNQSPYNKTNTLQVGIDKKLLLRTLKQYDKAAVVLKFSDHFSPLLLQLESDPSSRFDLIMPMRLTR